LKVKEIKSNPEILVLLLLIRLILFVDYLLTRASLGLVLLNVHLLVLHNYALLFQLHISINTVYIFIMVLRVTHHLLLIGVTSIVHGVLALSRVRVESLEI